MDSTSAPGRVHIRFFGRRNAGESGVLNAVTGQNLAVVPSVKGATTDSVYKTMGLLPLGPVTITSTPEIDGKRELGSLRIRKSYQALNRTDVAILAVGHCHGMAPEDGPLLKRIEEKRVPCVIVCNKIDSGQKDPGQVDWKQSFPLVKASALTGQGIAGLEECLTALGEIQEDSRRIVRDLLEPWDSAVLVMPIDKAAPKGRLILPQQQTVYDILEAGATAIVLKENEPVGVLPVLGKRPKMVITDSQVLARVPADTLKDILLTSFSILLARCRGDLEQLVEGVAVLDHTGKGDQTLVPEGCTHHRQCGDVGTVKPPSWIQGFTGTEPEFVFTSETEFPDGLGGYRLIIHYGGCMFNEQEMRYRMKCTRDQCIPMANYGVTIAYIYGILRCSLGPFPCIAALLSRRKT